MNLLVLVLVLRRLQITETVKVGFLDKNSSKPSYSWESKREMAITGITSVCHHKITSFLVVAIVVDCPFLVGYKVHESFIVLRLLRLVI